MSSQCPFCGCRSYVLYDIGYTTHTYKACLNCRARYLDGKWYELKDCLFDGEWNSCGDCIEVDGRLKCTRIFQIYKARGLEYYNCKYMSNGKKIDENQLTFEEFV